MDAAAEAVQRKEKIMRLIDADELTRQVFRKLHIANSYRDITHLIDNAPTIELSADRSKYNLELIRDIVRELGHLDSYIADTYLRPNNKIHIQFENIFSDDCYFLEDDKYILAELEKIATDTEDCVEFTLTNNKKVIIHSEDRPKGEWLDEDGDKVEIDDNGITEGSCWCSVCGEWLVASDEYPTKGNFCPNCGVDMRGDIE